jgi:5-methylcytosine-specific restriction endonuclease McrA
MREVTFTPEQQAYSITALIDSSVTDILPSCQHLPDLQRRMKKLADRLWTPPPRIQDRSVALAGDERHIIFCAILNYRRVCEPDFDSQELTRRLSSDAREDWDSVEPLEPKQIPEALRERVYAQHGSECVKCGMSDNRHLAKHDRRLAIHHILPRSYFATAGDADRVENLVPTCSECHASLEQSPSKVTEAVRDDSKHVM